MLEVDLTGKTAFIAGVGDDKGFGWAIAKRLNQAGATVLVGTWPPVYDMFKKILERGKLDTALDDGGTLEIADVFPLDAVYDTMKDVPREVRESKRYAQHAVFALEETAKAVKKKYGKIDILVHALANGPEVHKDLLETSREGYLTAFSTSAYSLVSLVQKFGPVMNEGGSVVSLTYLAADGTVPGYGGGMGAAKAALQSDTRTLAFEAGRKWNIRVNTISAGPLRSRAARAIGFIDKAVKYSMANAPLTQDFTADHVGTAATFLLSPLAGAITGTTMYVDNGLHSMAMAPAAIE
ncbi:enoyl-[acyl-carrier-protein] reductase [Chitinivibrio alkaliphilus]|uniref:Enoyl-[acyl-carrier-protein] reductase [NADH] n=1 Tax=Chitinivibrio alkaliphilus ACht1 TaxID=1313304 RepID=U7D787_9BACT|nr:enoyl-[acyl-carrier-protein] reductase [Chitinivibrio alkaliphilus]ERP31431.1 enoyl-ACP reductase [Chitinivibrio alkaliphilus ACht1]